MHKGDVGELLGDALDEVHIAEAGGVDQRIAAAGQFANHALGVGAFRHVLDIFCFHLVTQRLLHLQASLVVLIGPAGIADRADVDEAHLQRIGCLRVAQQSDAKCRGHGHTRCCLDEMSAISHQFLS
ncbi:hypothetical protein D3C72_1916620 [compost metagenome]